MNRRVGSDGYLCDYQQSKSYSSSNDNDDESSNPFSPPIAGIPQKRSSSQQIKIPARDAGGSDGSTMVCNLSGSIDAASLSDHVPVSSPSPLLPINLSMSTAQLIAPLANSSSGSVTGLQSQHAEVSASDQMILSSSSLSSTTNENRTSKDYYFDSYSHHGIHEEMLKDEVRTKTYQMAILKNRHLFEGKIVLDVGCGTGILSMFAAQAGAGHVYGVDSSGIIEQARLVVAKNGFQGQITLIHGKIEEIELPVRSVDIIISEWMGYFLLYESMLDTVLFARDKWLAKDPFSQGIIFPDKAIMFVGAIENTTDRIKNDRIDYWENVYGFDMTPIKDIAMQEPVIDIISGKSVISDCVPILTLDLLKCTKENLSFRSKFTLQASRDDYFGGIVAYFEVGFTQIHKPIGFSTSPFAKYTHWKQTLFFFEEEHCICEGEKFYGEIMCVPNQKNPRDLDISLQVKMKGSHAQFESSMNYRLR